MNDVSKIAKPFLRRKYSWLLYMAIITASYFQVFELYANYYWKASSLSGIYTQAPFILAVVLFLVWRKRDLFRAEGSRYPLVAAYALLLPAAALKIHGDMLGYSVLRGLTLIPLLLGLIAIDFPRKTVHALLFPIAYLLFAIPLPTFLLDQILIPLQHATTVMAAAVLPQFGFQVQRTGFTLLVAEGVSTQVYEIVISDGCSGVRSLFSALAVGTLYLYLRPIRSVYRVMLGVVLIPLSIAANLLRVVVTAFLIVRIDPELGRKFFHNFSGIIAFALVLCLLFAIEALLKSRIIKGKSSHE